ncbi:MAG TPA: ChaN family lipoprotein [Candidatus Polarisedimenticolia bacterium]|nr:ChaN family lipoprotein [Candidatus Polarisedimenticolia bacterium]
MRYRDGARRAGTALACLLALAAAAVVAGDAPTAEKRPLPVLEEPDRARMQAWLDRHALAPVDYVVAKFADHDIVFLGEYHRIRHDAVLVQTLIPHLYRAGVYNLGLEFLGARDQAALDGLLAADAYDEALAGRLFWNQWPFWGYQEYVDILRAAWTFNHGLPRDARRFRVVGLNARTDFSHVWTPEDRANPEIMAKALPDGDVDEVMAETVRREILAKRQKALIYSGSNHAYTRFRQPVPNAATGGIDELVSTRLGNRIFADIGKRCWTIFLHSPWPAAEGYSKPEVYPADGVIDAFFAAVAPAKRRVGFDVKGSPFAGLEAKSSLWGRAPRFRLEKYADGWIYQMPLSEYRGVSGVPGWFNEANRMQAIEQIANPDPLIKRRDRTVEELTTAMLSDTDFARRFARFH